jgi:alpha-L-arabinofuranosidase
MESRTELAGPDLGAANSAAKPNAVRPAAIRIARGDAGRYAVTLKPASWNVLRFRVGGSGRSA